MPSANHEDPFTAATTDAVKKAVGYWQIASVVEEGGDSHTVNLCQQCYNVQMVQQGKSRLNSWQWRADVEKKAHRGRVGKIMEK